jgi:flavin reductase (DIM6/NTAB) family NADH-FMN oxidoreductase RutF
MTNPEPVREHELMAVEVDEQFAAGASPRVDRATFFASMAAFPTGVTVVTTVNADGHPVGLTCNAFTSVSAEPPLVLVSVDNHSNTLPALLAERRFVVNFLAAGRGDLATACAGKGDQKFAEISWAPSAHGLPVLAEDSIAYVVCELVQELQAGDHVLLIGAVQEASPPAPDAVPLLYFRREFDSWPAAGDRPGA